MKLPARDIGPWAEEIIDECDASRQVRVANAKEWRSLYFSGSTGDQTSINNRVRRHINRLAALLFAAEDARFSIEFDVTDGEPWMSRGNAAASYLNREMARSGISTLFGQGVRQGLMQASTFMKIMWNRDGLDPYLIDMGSMGVLKEDLEGLDRQEAFTHTQWLTPGQFAFMLSGHPEEEEIKRRVEAHFAARAEDQDKDESYLHQIIIGGVNPVTTTPPPQTQYGQVSIVGGPYSMLARSVMSRLIRVTELWVMDDEREDWTTIRMCDPGIVLEGKLTRRNFSGVKGETGFIQICPNMTPGYFWGESEIEPIKNLQILLNDRLNDFNKIVSLQSMPPKAFIGFSGMNREKYRAAMSRGGFIAEDAPNAKIEDLAPQLPPESMEQINQIISWFDDVAGFTPALQGQGDAGVRAGTHAQTLVRSSAPGMMDRALLLEKQWTEVGDFCFKLLQEKEARVFVSDKKEHFLLNQMPDDFRVSVDSHSASPAFRQDTIQLAFALHKSGAIDNEDLIKLTRPPGEDTLIARARERAKAEAAFAQAHPELLAQQHKLKHKAG